MKNKSLFYFIIYIAVRFAHTAELCTLPGGGGYGKCIPINNCPTIASLVNVAKSNSKVADYIRSLRCGSLDEIKVCCSDCFNPDGKPGACIKFKECPNLNNLNSTKSNRNYVRNSLCPSGGTDVCCGPPPAIPMKGNCENQITAFPPNPETECCGIEASGQNRITGGNRTAIDQYPWLVLLEHVNNTGIFLHCGGALISNKYVLTAAHCVQHHNLPMNVRLGEYDIMNDGKDCVDGNTDCTDPVVTIPIKQIIVYSEHNKNHKRNDIALVRLDGVAPYTDFIRPICLPTLDISKLQSNLDLYVAGWGRTSNSIQDKYGSRLKQHVKVPMVNMQDCLNQYHVQISQKIQLWSKQLCAGGEEGRDSCDGDSGGPLMMETLLPSNLTVITAEGIVSFGPNYCGTKDLPGVYTKVYEYNTWIRSQIRP